MNMVSSNALSAREKEVGELLSQLAEELCDEALKKEKALSSKSHTPYKLCVSLWGSVFLSEQDSRKTNTSID